MLHALLPLKDLVSAKTRLAGVLAPSERRALMQAMAEDVLAVLAGHPAVDAITLLSDDPGAALLAGNYGARHCPEQSLACSGLNAVLAAACGRLPAKPGDSVLVLHADLPSLGAADIEATLGVKAEMASGAVVIGTDRRGEGTNLLLFDADRLPDFRFGPDSCARHLAWARRSGVKARVLRRPGIAGDVDQPEDLSALVSGGATQAMGPATRTWLDSPGLAARLRLALESLDRSGLEKHG